MDKLNLTSKDKVQENIEKIKALFPNAVTEVLRDGKPMLAVDFDVLKQEMSSVLIDDKEERYQFTWPDKKKSVLLANTPISATLRPCKEESVDFDNTENLYIEGDNLDVLKLLQETYLGEIKMIYIDPPYNTGNDFVYEDDFAMCSKEYAEINGQYDEQGNRLFENKESNGRFHTDWLNMIYPRLRLARDLLTDDGVIFININDNEVDNLIKIAREIFGNKNVDVLIWQKTDPWVDKNTNSKMVARFLEFKEYVVVVYKNKELTTFNKVFRLPDWKNAQKNVDNDKRGNWQSGIFSYEEGHKNEDKNSSSYFEITTPSGKKYLRHWFCEDEIEYKKLDSQGLLYYGKNLDSAPRLKIFENLEKPFLLTSIMRGYGTTSTAKQEILDIFGEVIFETPKPVKLVKEIIRTIVKKNNIVLDFFSGSATTAHAVMQLNAEDGGNRKYIMVQLPEKCDEKSEAYKAGYKNICEIGKERIRRAGKKIKEENSLITANLDTGFRVLKLDSSNMKPVYYKPEDYTQDLLTGLEDNIKEDRTPLDLLFQVMLELGKPLSAKIEEKVIGGKNVFIVNDDDLIACFDSNITEEVVKQIALMKPLYVVFRDSSMANDSVNTNFEQIFATYSPNTIRKVL